MLLIRCFRDQPVSLVDIEALGRQQDRGRAARRDHELMHAGAMRKRRHHQRGILFGRAGDEIAKMVGDDEAHLAMGQHGRLGAPGRAGGEEEPAGIVMLDRGVLDLLATMARDHRADLVLAERPLADPPDKLRRRARSRDRRRMLREIAMAEEALRARGRGEIRDLVRQ